MPKLTFTEYFEDAEGDDDDVIMAGTGLGFSCSGHFPPCPGVWRLGLLISNCFDRKEAW